MKKNYAAPSGPASLCKKAVDGRFPFTAGSTNDIPLDDFSRLFSAGGLLDKFFNDNLQNFVDTSGTTWKAQPVAGVAPPVTPSDLAQFQKAAQIRDLFFAGGGAQPTVRFDITPADTDAKQVTLDLDGQAITYAHGPVRATSVTWPGQNRMSNVRLCSTAVSRWRKRAVRGRCSACSDRGRWRRPMIPIATRSASPWVSVMHLMKSEPDRC